MADKQSTNKRVDVRMTWLKRVHAGCRALPPKATGDIDLKREKSVWTNIIRTLMSYSCNDDGQVYRDSANSVAGDRSSIVFLPQGNT